MTSTSVTRERRSAPADLLATGGLSIGAGFFSARDEVMLVLLLVAVAFGFRYVVGRSE